MTLGSCYLQIQILILGRVPLVIPLNFAYTIQTIHTCKTVGMERRSTVTTTHEIKLVKPTETVC